MRMVIISSGNIDVARILAPRIRPDITLTRTARFRFDIAVLFTPSRVMEFMNSVKSDCGWRSNSRRRNRSHVWAYRSSQALS